MLGDSSRATICGGDAIATFRDDDPRVADHHRTRISIGPERRLKPWGWFRSLAVALETITMECGDTLGASSGSGTMRATEGDALGMCSMNGLDSERRVW
jgi:hypothetical protein